MSKLQLSQHLTLPLSFLEHRKVVFGGSGAGKTAFGRTLFEEATKAGVVCGAIDLKADWWGLKSTADGKCDGIPVVIFGGEHQDVPLDEQGGATTADIVVDLRQPFILDLEHFSKRKQMIFLAAFAERLYDRNREPLVMFWDEVDRYAPQKPMNPEANICLGAMEDVAKRGRKHGIFSVFITQRNASLNKSVSELCDVSIVFRTPGPRDQEAVEEWFSTKATREQRDEVMTKLAGLDTGTAVICSAHPKMKLFSTVPIRLPWTFDSSATPEIGRRMIQPKQLAQPDLQKIRERMASTIEKAKAEDPKELRRQLDDRVRQNDVLSTKIRVLEASPAENPDVQIKEVQVLGVKDLNRLDQYIDRLMKYQDRLTQAQQVVVSEVRILRDVIKQASMTPHVPMPRSIIDLPSSFLKGAVPLPVRQPKNPMRYTESTSNEGLSKMARTMLVVLAQHPNGLTKGQILVHADYRSSGPVSSTFAQLLSHGWVSMGNGLMMITDAGLKELGSYQALPTGTALLEYLLDGTKLSTMEKALLRCIGEAAPSSMSKGAVLAATGYASSGPVSSAFAKLVACQYVRATGRSELKLADELMG